MQECKSGSTEKELIIKMSDISNYKPGSRVIKKHQIVEWSERNPIQSKMMSKIIKGHLKSSDEKVSPLSTCFKIIIKHKHHNNRLSLAVMEWKAGSFEKSLRSELSLDHENEVARDIAVEGFGHFLIAVRSQFFDEERVSMSMFVGDNLTHFRFENARRAASSTANIIKKILEGKEVILENINLFVLAIERGKISSITEHI
ncbi:MAG: hypothetical protein WCI36_03240 [bacterium]